jgi:hypothetical protein
MSITDNRILDSKRYVKPISKLYCIRASQKASRRERQLTLKHRSLSFENEHDQENTGSPLGWSTLACPTESISHSRQWNNTLSHGDEINPSTIAPDQSLPPADPSQPNDTPCEPDLALFGTGNDSLEEGSIQYQIIQVQLQTIDKIFKDPEWHAKVNQHVARCLPKRFAQQIYELSNQAKDINADSSDEEGDGEGKEREDKSSLNTLDNTQVIRRVFNGWRSRARTATLP